MSQRNPSGRLKDDRVHNNESPTIHLRDFAAEDANITDGKNLSQIMIPGTKESNVIDLELNSGAKVSQSQPAERSKDAGSTAGNNRSKIINSANKEKNVFDLESNSGNKASHSKRSGRLKTDSAYEDNSSAIDIRDSVSEHAGVTVGNDLSQIIIAANEESIVPKLTAQKVWT